MLRRLGSEKFGKTVFLVSLVLASVFLARVAFAQGAPNDYQIGLPQHGEFSGTDFEHVQMNNNNLHIDLPLWSTAGRGPYRSLLVDLVSSLHSDSLLFLGRKNHPRPIMTADVRVATFYELTGILPHACRTSELQRHWEDWKLHV